MSNEKKSHALGMNFGTANGRLRKLILFDLLQRFDFDQCFRCNEQIEDVDDLSIEHKEPWESAPDPKASFFDLKNIAFSHLRCNVGAPRSEKTHCPVGHPYDEDNTRNGVSGGGGPSRQCRACDRLRMKKRYRTTDWRKRRKSFPSRKIKLL